MRKSPENTGFPQLPVRKMQKAPVFRGFFAVGGLGNAENAVKLGASLIR
jgi:hypothetical protein